MSNKYLEKISFTREHIYKDILDGYGKFIRRTKGPARKGMAKMVLGGAAGLGTLVGLNSVLNQHIKNQFVSKRHQYSPKDAGLIGLGVGSIAGGLLGRKLHLEKFHGAAMSRIARMKLRKWQRKAQSYGGSNAFAHAAEDIGSIHKDLNSPRGFKSKTEFISHFRKQTSANHPDRFTPGTPEHTKATETMTRLNAARDKFMAHPDGFEKLASNKYLNHLFN